MKRKVKAGARFQQILYFFVGLCTAESLVEVGENNFRNFQTKRPGNFAADKFGNKRPRPLARPAEFERIQETIVGLGNSRKRTALAQRGHIPRYVYGTELRRTIIHLLY